MCRQLGRVPGGAGTALSRSARTALAGSARSARAGARSIAGRPWHTGAAALAAGLALAPASVGAQLAAAAAAAALPALARAPGAGAAAALLLLVGSAAGEARLAAIDRPARALGSGGPAELRAHALTHPRAAAFGSTVEVRVAGGRLAGAHLLVRVPVWGRWPRWAPIGQELALSGRLRPLGAGGSSGSFDFGAHLRRRGMAGELLLERARATGRRRGGLAGAVDRLRSRAERGVRAGLPAEERALLRGMVLGQDEAISEPLREAFRASGLAHILAVSGQNVMLLVALALPALALAGLGPGGRAVALLALIALYVPLAGAGPSLQRAGVMGGAAIVAASVARPASRVYALLAAAVVTLALNPRSCGDPGWQLSFVAVGGIVWLAPPLRQWLAPAGRVLAEGAAITIAATLATAPILGHHFGTVSLAGLPANLLALPAVAPAMWLGMLKAAIMQVEALSPALSPPTDAAAALLGRLARLPVAYIAWLAERFAQTPGSELRLPLGAPHAVAASYAALAAGAVGARRLAGRLGPHAQEAAARWRRLPRSGRTAAAAALLAALALLGARLAAAPSPPRELTVRFLDVGQGDATLVQHPDGSAVLFDGGPPEGGVAALLRKAGVRRLAAVVATHASRDHHGGLGEVLERYPVGVLLDGGDGSRDPAFRALLRAAGRRGVRRIAARSPLSLAAGGLRIRVLSPAPRAPGPAPEDPNPRAVVAVVSSGDFDLLLSADAESEALEPLALPDVDAMKVPHHGSADPGLPALLERLRPEVGAIEVGRNSYGHPAPSTLGALRAAGVRTLRTDRDGTITLSVAGGRMRLRSER